MRKELRWALGLTLVLTIAALMRPARSPQVIGAVDSPVDRRSDADTRSAVASVARAEPAQLDWPEHLEPWLLEPAKADIFVPTPVVAVSPVPRAPPPPPVAVSPSPVAPAAPPLVWRYLGRMLTPTGETLVLLSRADGTAISIQPGSLLEDGYEVRAIRQDAITLVFPPTGGEVDVPIPPAPSVR